MKAKSFVGMRCSIAGALEILGDRWAILVLRDLLLGLRRYEDIRRSTGMPSTTLSDRLKHLENVGLIKQQQYQNHPPRAEYLLTEKGRSAWIITFALAQWGDQWNASGAGAAPVNFVDSKSGHPLKLALIDSKTGVHVPVHQAMAQEGPGADETVRWRLRHNRHRAQNPEGK